MGRAEENEGVQAASGCWAASFSRALRCAIITVLRLQPSSAAIWRCDLSLTVPASTTRSAGESVGIVASTARSCSRAITVCSGSASALDAANCSPSGV